MKPIIAPSILSADFAHLEKHIKEAEEGGADYFHLDIMDGHFVPNISYGSMIAETMRRITKAPLDAHLMITNPDKFIPEFVEAGVDLIYPHIEASYDVYRTVKLISDLGAKAGITLNPGSPIEWVEPLIDVIDAVLIMSVPPGYGGQKFILESVERIRRLRMLLDDRAPEVQIAVDGGVSVSNIRELYEAGANFFIAGSSVFNAQDVAEAIRSLRRAALNE